MASKSVPKLSALRQALFKLFQQFDENDDKLIDFEEFTKAMAGFNVDDEKILPLFKKFDVDGQGIKYTEFLSHHDSAKFVAFLNALNIAYENDEQDDEKGADETDSDLLASLLKIAQQKTQALGEEVEQLRNEKNSLQLRLDELQTMTRNEKNLLQIRVDELQNINSEQESENERLMLQHKQSMQSTQAQLEYYKSKTTEMEDRVQSMSHQLTVCNQLNTRLKAENNRLLQSTQNLNICCQQLEEKCNHLETVLADIAAEEEHNVAQLYVAPMTQSIANRNRTRTIVQPSYFQGIHQEETQPEHSLSELHQNPETSTAETSTMTAKIDEIKLMLVNIQNDTQNIEHSVSSIKSVIDTAQTHKLKQKHKEEIDTHNIVKQQQTATEDDDKHSSIDTKGSWWDWW